MARKPIPKDVIAAVLVNSRRRCCICFGLDRDTRLAAGQIAHLDGNRDNKSEDNLAFLCFVHHDEYDSRTSQRKSLTIDEVERYREELVTTIKRAFTQQVHFGELRRRLKTLTTESMCGWASKTARAKAPNWT